MKHTLDVVGEAWGGFKSSYRYTVTPEQARDLIQGGVTAGSFAGDFASVTDWRLTETTRAYQTGRDFRRELIEERRLRNWQSPSNARFFARHMEN